jgi:hypothetical protein
MGGGLASRFSLALSRVIDNTTEDPDEQQEFLGLICELNSHQDLTMKLSNQQKICSVLKN